MYLNELSHNNQAITSKIIVNKLIYTRSIGACDLIYTLIYTRSSSSNLRGSIGACALIKGIVRGRIFSLSFINVYLVYVS